MSATGRARHWRRTRVLVLAMLGLLVLFAFVVHLFADTLNAIVILGFPLGYYMAAQGSLVALVAMLFVFAIRQDSIDDQHDVAED